LPPGSSPARAIARLSAFVPRNRVNHAPRLTLGRGGYRHPPAGAFRPGGNARYRPAWGTWATIRNAHAWDKHLGEPSNPRGDPRCASGVLAAAHGSNQASLLGMIQVVIDYPTN
jgi:hypothetical protein